MAGYPLRGGMNKTQTVELDQKVKGILEGLCFVRLRLTHPFETWNFPAVSCTFRQVLPAREHGRGDAGAAGGGPLPVQEVHPLIMAHGPRHLQRNNTKFVFGLIPSAGALACWSHLFVFALCLYLS